MPRADPDSVEDLWLTIHMEEKPQAKNRPEDNERQAAIMDNPFLLLLLCFNRRRYLRFESGGSADIFTTLIAVIVTLRHLSVAERTRLHHGYSFPQGRHGLCILVCRRHTSWRILSAASPPRAALSVASMLGSPAGHRHNM